MCRNKILFAVVVSAFVLLSACSTPRDERAGKLFSYVPDDTVYLIANTEPLPKGFYDGQLRQLKEMFAGTAIKGMARDAGDDMAPGERFFVELMAELANRAESDELEKVGLSGDARSVVYAYDLAPVIRGEVQNMEAFKAMLQRVEKRSGYTLNWQKCGELDCLSFSGNGKAPLSIEVVLHPGHYAVAVFPRENKARGVEHLIGARTPAESYSVARFEEFLEKNGYRGMGAGFVELDKMADRVAAAIAGALKQEGKAEEAARVRQCVGVAKSLLVHMPRMIFGAKEIKEKRVRAEVVFEATPQLAKTLQGIPARLAGMQRVAHPVVDFGMGVNVPRLRDGLIDLLKHIEVAAEKSGCTAIRPDAMQKASMAIGMAMGLGVSQLQGLYVAVNNVELDDQMKPSEIDMRFSIAADDPVGLLRMVAAFVPSLASLELPEDGKSVPLPAAALPPGSPPVSIARNGKFLNVIVGKGDAKTVQMDATHPALLWSTLDGPRYYSTLGDVIEQASVKFRGGKDPQEAEQALATLRAIEKFTPVVSQRVYPDSRGLVVDFDIRYP